MNHGGGVYQDEVDLTVYIDGGDIASSPWGRSTTRRADISDDVAKRRPAPVGAAARGSKHARAGRDKYVKISAPASTGDPSTRSGIQ